MSLQQVSQLTERARGLTDFSRSTAAPLEQQILAEGRQRNISDVMTTLGDASTAAAGSANAAEGIYERQLRGLGVNQSDSAKRSAQRRLGLSRALSSVDARNRMVEGMRNRTDIARSAAADLRSVVEGNAFRASTAAATMEADREIQYQSELAEYKQKKAAGLGQLASMAAMFIPGVGPLVAPAIGAAVTKKAIE